MSQTLAPPQRPDLRRGMPMAVPSVAGYWIGAVVGILGLALVGVLAVTGVLRMDDHIDAFPRMVIPGTVTITLDGGIGRTLYVEGIAPMPLAALDIRVTDPRGDEVAVRPYAAVMRYDVPGSPGYIGHAVGTFRTTVGGTYRIESAATAPPGTNLAVGDSVVAGIVGYAVGAFLVLLMTIAGALAILITTAVRRSRARRAG